MRFSRLLTLLLAVTVAIEPIAGVGSPIAQSTHRWLPSLVPHSTLTNLIKRHPAGFRRSPQRLLMNALPSSTNPFVTAESAPITPITFLPTAFNSPMKTVPGTISAVALMPNAKGPITGPPTCVICSVPRPTQSGLPSVAVPVISPVMLLRPVEPQYAPPDPIALGIAQLRLKSPIPIVTTGPIHAPEAREVRLINGPTVRDLVKVRGKSTRRRNVTSDGNYTLSTGVANVTGMNPWWTYEERVIPGGGTYKINVGNDNLLLQYNDLVYTSQGIGLDFRRTWNSTQSQQEGNSIVPQSMYGNGWTNTFDAHILMGTDVRGNPTLSVYDVDGGRYDYSAGNSTMGTPGYWIPPPGEHTALTWDGNNGYFWTKKDGTVYYFYSPAIGQDNPQFSAYAGKLSAIFSRNHNASLTLKYSFDNDDTGTSLALLNHISVTHSNGAVAGLSFSTIDGRRLLTDLIWPDGTDVHYSYDSTGGLSEVDLPGYKTNQTVSQLYNFSSQSGGQVAVWTPRYYAASQTGSSRDGMALFFSFANYRSGYNGFSMVQECANLNPTFGSGSFADGYSSGLLQPTQPAYLQNSQVSWTATLYDGVNPFTNQPVEEYNDSDGHAEQLYSDTLARVVVRSVGTASGTPLTSYQLFDQDNNVIASTDFRNSAYSASIRNYTNYMYDSNGNTVASAKPAVTDPSTGSSYRPTKWFAYDTYNNLIAFCDETYVHSVGGDWNNGTTPSCGQSSQANGATQFFYNNTSSSSAAAGASGYEPNGELTMMETPLGYERTYAYATAPQGGTDYGQATGVQGAVYSQLNGTQNSDAITVSYGAKGTMSSYDNGIGTQYYTYDSMNRMLTSEDPTGITATKSYNPNGTLASESTPSQASANIATLYTYDADGDIVTTSSHHGCPANTSCVPGATTRFYDGRDRLIETVMPWNQNDFGSGNDAYPFPWMSRNIYDISQGGAYQLVTDPLPSSNVSSKSYSFSGFGNLVKTQEYLPAAYPTLPVSSGATGQWLDQKATSFDKFDRPTATGEAEDGLQITNSYDQTTDSLGDLTGTCDSLNRCVQYTYDYDGNKIADIFSDPSGRVSEANKSYAYDPNGRPLLQADTSLDNFSYAYVYDDDGRKIQTEQNATEGLIRYGYYPDGKRASLTANTNSQQFDFDYAYQADGRRSWFVFSNAGTLESTISMGYDKAGRLLNRTEATLGSQQFTYTLSYDAFGRLYAYAFPGGNFGAYNYDQDDTETSVTLDVGSTTAVNSLTLNNRGEILTSTQNPESSMRSADGLMINRVASVPFQKFSYHLISNSSGSFDAILGRNLNETANSCTPAQYQSGQTTCYTASSSQTYDALGNMLTSGSGYVGTDGSDQNSSTNRTYDFEHHTTQTLGAFASAYQWGPNKHPMLIGAIPAGIAPYSYDRLHWDNDSLLYTTDSNFAIDDIKVDNYGDFYKGVFTFLDRDSSGSVAGCHNQNGNTVTATGGFLDRWDPSGRVPQVCGSGSEKANVPPYVWDEYKYPSQASKVGSGGILIDGKSDGWFDGNNIFQGVRTFDPTASTWTTPDLYAGTVTDPRTQNSYMWDNNNSVVYSDPSGYLSENQQAILLTAIDRLGWVPSNSMCTDFVTKLYRDALQIDLRGEVKNAVMSDGLKALKDFNMAGARSGNFAGNVKNLYQFFATTGQLVPAGSKLQTGDVIFLMGKDGTFAHVAVVGQVDRDGNPLTVAEAQGMDQGMKMGTKSYSDFAKSAAPDFVAGIGRDTADGDGNGDAGAGDNQGGYAFFDPNTGLPL